MCICKYIYICIYTYNISIYIYIHIYIYIMYIHIIYILYILLYMYIHTYMCVWSWKFMTVMIDVGHIISDCHVFITLCLKISRRSPLSLEGLGPPWDPDDPEVQWPYNHLEVSMAMGGPNSWMVYKGKSYENGWWLGVPLFQEITTCKWDERTPITEVIYQYNSLYRFWLGHNCRGKQ